MLEDRFEFTLAAVSLVEDGGGEMESLAVERCDRFGCLDYDWDAGCRRVAVELFEHAEAVDSGHPQIKHDHIWWLLAC